MAEIGEKCQKVCCDEQNGYGGDHESVEQLKMELEEQKTENFKLTKHISALEELIGAYVYVVKGLLKESSAVEKRTAFQRSRCAGSGNSSSSQESLEKHFHAISEYQNMGAKCMSEELDLEGRLAGARSLSSEERKTTKWRKTGLRKISVDHRDTF